MIPSLTVYVVYTLNYFWRAALTVLAVLAVLTLLAPRAAAQDLLYSYPISKLLQDGDTFDYVVVGAGATGAGATGAVAAARLAAAGHAVLLVEAGGDPDPLSKIPAAAMGLLGSEVDWKYPTVPNNKSCLSSIDKGCRFSRGKCLGGSSSINYMLFTRGNRQDFDDFGIPGWSWEDLKPYFLRYEGFQEIELLPRSSLPFHNDSGMLKMDYFADPENPWHERIARGLLDLGFPPNPDVNGVSQIGVTKSAGYVYGGERMSTARAYLAVDKVQGDLSIAKYAFCTGVIFEGDDNTAVGVTVVQNNINITLNIYARKEVILSAGTIGSAQILLQSGIGPAEHLQEMGISVRVDLPVGRNLVDHVLPLLIVLVRNDKSVLEEAGQLVGTVLSLAEYLVGQGGPLASNFVDLTSFANTSCYNCCKKKLRAGEDCELPSLQLINAFVNKGLLPLAKPLFQNAIHLNDDLIEQLAEANKKNDMMIMSPIVLQPYSNGTVKLASRNPWEPPAIFANYLADERDVDEMMRSIRIIEDLMETPPFKNNNAKLFIAQLPDCPEYAASRWGYWRCYVRHLTYSVFHAVGTCALGAVVDVHLRVLGTKRLRVADASVLPYIVRGNTEAVCVAIGERLLDLIAQTAPTDAPTSDPP